MDEPLQKIPIQKKDWFLLPNLFTLSRILSIPPAIHSLHTQNHLGSGFWMFFLFLTDFLDGKIARSRNQVSLLGSILDPVADKLVVLSLFSYFFILGEVPWIYFLLILVRDVLQLLAVPILLFWKKRFFKVRPKLLPKIGTACNFILLALLILKRIFPEWWEQFGFINYGMLGLYFVSGLLEVYILVTFIPRFFQIYSGRHDTFE